MKAENCILSKRRLLSFLPLPATLAGVLLFVYTPLVFGNVVISRDVGYLYYAVHKYISERLGSGELPLWYPYEALGVPFIASAVTAVFHPLSWLSVIFGPIRGMWAGHLIAVCIAITGAWLLARKLGMGNTGASIAAISFGGSGPLVSMLDNQPFFLGPVAFPWLLLGALGAISAYERDRYLISEANGIRKINILSSTASWIVLAAASLAWIVLAGDMQGAMVMGLSTLFICVISAGTNKIVHSLVIVSTAGILGTMLSFVQLFNSIEAASSTTRSLGYSWEHASRWSLHPMRLTEFFMPHQTYLDKSLEIGEWLYPCSAYAWSFSLYIGAFVLFGAVYAAVSSDNSYQKKPLVYSLLILSVFLLWMALGHWGGVYRLAYDFIPLWDSFRYPEKLAAHAVLPLALLGGLGLENALHSPKKAVLVSGIMTLMMLLISITTWLIYVISNESANHSVIYISSMLMGSVKVTLIYGALFFILLILWKKIISNIIIPGTVITAFALFDISGPNERVLDTNTASPLSLEAPSLSGKWLRENGGIKSPEDYRIATERMKTIYGVQLPSGIASDISALPSMIWNRHALQHGHADVLGFERTGAYLPVRTIRHYHLYIQMKYDIHTFISGVFSQRYHIIGIHETSPEEFPYHRMAFDLSNYNLVILENPNALPRIYLADPIFTNNSAVIPEGLLLPQVINGKKAWVEVHAPPAWLDLLENTSSFHKVDGIPKKEILPDEKAKSDFSVDELNYSPSSNRYKHGKVHIINRHFESIEIMADLKRPALLVLNDAWWPDWEVTVNHEKAKIYRVNYLVMGILLDKGTHDIEFTYKTPKSLKIGFLISMISIFICLVPLITRLFIKPTNFSS